MLWFSVFCSAVNVAHDDRSSRMQFILQDSLELLTGSPALVC
jgi:hypothetical protein